MLFGNCQTNTHPAKTLPLNQIQHSTLVLVTDLTVSVSKYVISDSGLRHSLYSALELACRSPAFLFLSCALIGENLMPPRAGRAHSTVVCVHQSPAACAHCMCQGERWPTDTHFMQNTTRAIRGEEGWGAQAHVL